MSYPKGFPIGQGYPEHEAGQAASHNVSSSKERSAPEGQVVSSK